MNKTVASVIDDINEWENPRGGSVFYVTAICTDEDVLSVGRKDHDAALEVQGLLREAIGVEQDFVLEPAKPTKTGRTKWKVLGFGIPGGAATYTAPGVQGTAGTSDVARPRNRSPEHDVQGGGGGDNRPDTAKRSARSPEHDVDASIRAAVALKAAASFLSMSAVSMEKVLEVAEFFEEWLQRKASEPASSAYRNGSGTVTPVGQAGAGSEESSGSEQNPRGKAPTGDWDRQEPDLSGEEVGEAAVAHLGEGTPASSSHYEMQSYEGEGAPTKAPEHIHDYQIRQGVKGFLVCECGKTRKKETAAKT